MQISPKELKPHYSCGRHGNMAFVLDPMDYVKQAFYGKADWMIQRVGALLPTRIERVIRRNKSCRWIRWVTCTTAMEI